MLGKARLEISFQQLRENLNPFTKRKNHEVPVALMKYKAKEQRKNCRPPFQEICEICGSVIRIQRSIQDLPQAKL
jgi:hypothetical protein